MSSCHKLQWQIWELFTQKRYNCFWVFEKTFIFDLLINWNKFYRKLNFLCIDENSFIAIKLNPWSVFFCFFFFPFFYLKGKERIEPPFPFVEETAGSFGTKLCTSKYLFNTDIRKVLSLCVCVCVYVCVCVCEWGEC